MYDAQTLVNECCEGMVFSTHVAYSRDHVYEYRHITDYPDVFRNFLLSFNQMLKRNLNIRRSTIRCCIIYYVEKALLSIPRFNPPAVIICLDSPRTPISDE